MQLMEKNDIVQIGYKDYPKEPVALDNLSVKFMKQAVFVPLELQDTRLRVVITSYSIHYTKLYE